MINMKEKTFDTMNHDHKGLGVDHDFPNKKSWSPKNEKKKIRERKRSNILFVRKLCTKGERELEIYNKKSQK